MRWTLALVVALAGCPPPGLPMGSDPPCTLEPNEVDFGEVPSGQLSTPQRLVLRNDSPHARLLLLAAPPRAFIVFSSPPPFFVDAFSTQTFDLGFQPDDGRLHFGELTLTEDRERAPETKCEVTASLRGLGGGRVTVDPPSLALQIEPDETVTAELRIDNSQRKPVTLTAHVELRQTLAGGQAIRVPLGPIELPALGSVVLPVTVGPHAPDIVLGSIVVTVLGSGATFRTPFTVQVGKPVAEVLPSELNNWRVRYDHGSTPSSFSERRLTVRNVGSSGQLAPLALRLARPAFFVESISGDLDEFFPLGSSALSDGLAQGERAELVFRLTPRSLGPKEFRVKLFFDEPLVDPFDPLDLPDPVVDVVVRANVEAMPDCELSVDPGTLLELAVTNGRLEGSVTFTNTGQTSCLVDALHLDAATTLPDYFIVAGRADQFEVLPGASYEVRVAGPLQPSPRLVGQLAFHVFNRDSVVQKVELRSP